MAQPHRLHRPLPLDEARAPPRPASEREDCTLAEADAILNIVREAAMRPDASCRDQFDYVVLAVLRYAGLRRGEVIVLRLGDLDLDLDLDRRRVRVDGKGVRICTVPLPPVLVEVLQWYLTDVRPYLPASKMLFANPNAQRAAHQGITCEKGHPTDHPPLRRRRRSRRPPHAPPVEADLRDATPAQW